MYFVLLHKQEILINITVCGTWNGVIQDLEEMDNLDDFKISPL